jgi:N-acylneuraminate cytidylyltransferase
VLGLGDKCWAIIPARGGSTGVVGKNIKLLNNKPLIGYAIEALQSTNLFEKIVVTSDDNEILEVAKNFGAEIYMRTEPNESNNVTMPDVPTASYLNSIPMRMRPKFCLMVQCTAPFVKPDSYRKAYNELQRRDDSTVFAAHLAHSFLWQREHENDDDSKWLPINHPFNERVGRQFSKFQQVNETGAFYGFPVETFLQAGHRFFSKAYPILIERDEIIDINDLTDWEFAQFKIYRRERPSAN